MKMRDKAESETGERKSYLINITAEVDEMKRRAMLVKDFGNEYVMIDILTIGWAAVQTVRNKPKRASDSYITPNVKNDLPLSLRCCRNTACNFSLILPRAVR